MDNPAENPSKAAEYLQELNKIIETQQGLLDKQRLRIDELELQVAELCADNTRLQEQHQRHMSTCRLAQQSANLVAHPGTHPGAHMGLGAVSEGAMSDRHHASLPLELSERPLKLMAPPCRRGYPCRKWKSASFGLYLMLPLCYVIQLFKLVLQPSSSPPQLIIIISSTHLFISSPPPVSRPRGKTCKSSTLLS